MLLVFNFCTLLRTFYARTVLSCVYFEIFYFELLGPEILGAANAILRPLNNECSGIDRFSCDSSLPCDTFMHVPGYTYVVLTVCIECSGFDPIFLRFCTLVRHIYPRIPTYYLPCVRSCDPSVYPSIKAHTSSFTEFVF